MNVLIKDSIDFTDKSENGLTKFSGTVKKFLSKKKETPADLAETSHVPDMTSVDDLSQRGILSPALKHILGESIDSFNKEVKAAEEEENANNNKKPPPGSTASDVDSDEEVSAPLQPQKILMTRQ